MAPRTVFRMVFVLEAQTKNETRKLALHFWRLSLGNPYTLAKAMCARATSRGAGLEARGEGRERGNSIETTSKPPVAHRAGGICFEQDTIFNVFGARAHAAGAFLRWRIMFFVGTSPFLLFVLTFLYLFFARWFVGSVLS